MDIIILKTNIKSHNEFIPVKNSLHDFYKVNDCSIDLEDRDKVLRVTGNNLNQDDVISKVKSFGFLCEELLD
jgi:hypothetical protein